MSNYIVSDTDLTSVADAIRTKAETNSSLVFPSGFVTAINSITTSSGPVLGTKTITTNGTYTATDESLQGYSSVTVNIPYDWIGEKAEYVMSICNSEYNLASTNFSNWTPSTSTGNLTTAESLSSVSLSGEYDYIQKVSGYVNFVYTTTPDPPYILESYNSGILVFGRRPNSLANLSDGIFNSATTGASLMQTLFVLKQANGTISISNNNYGMYYTISGPSFSNQTSANFGCVLKTPYVRATANNSYMPASAFNLLDTSATTFHIKSDLYSCQQNDIWHGPFQDIITMYQTNHSTT